MAKLELENLDHNIQKRVQQRLTALLGERAPSACAAQFICSSLLIGMSTQKSENNTPSLCGFALIVLGSIVRFLSGRILSTRSNSKNALVAFSGAIILQSSGWVLLVSGYIYFSGLSHLMTQMSLLFGAAIATGATASLSPKLRLAQTYLLIKIGMTASVLLLLGENDAKWLGVNCAIFLIFIIKQAESNHKSLMMAEYWRLDAKEKEKRIEAVFNAVPAHISVISKDMQYLQSNRFLNQKLFTTNAIEGEDVGTIERFKDFKSILDDFVNTRSSGGEVALQRELNFIGEAGGEETWFLTISFITLDNGIGFIVTLTDISAVKFAERELSVAKANAIQLSKFAAIGELAAGMAHEVNNPLTIMAGHLNILTKRLAPNSASENAKGFESIRTQISRITGVVHGFLRYSTIDHSKMESLDSLNEVLRRGVERVMPEMKHLGRRIFMNSANEKITFTGNASALEAAMSGLLLQAASEFTLNHNVINIELLSRESNAAGITLRIFTTDDAIKSWSHCEIFPTEDRQTTAQTNWIGITIARDIFERHGGTVVATGIPTAEYIVELAQSCELKTLVSA